MEKNILNILPSVNEEVYWDGYLDEIESGVEEYQSKFKSNKKEAEECLNKILPKYWKVFHTHNTYRRRNGELLKRDDSDEACLPSYDIGIFLVGYSSLPIALSLAEIQPTEQIYFLYSSDTKPILLEIGDRLQKMLDDSHQRFVDCVATTALSNQEDSALAIDKPSDPVATFKRIKEIIDNIDDADNKRIALDLTGGKKTMLGGGYTAGAIWASRWSEAAQGLVPFCDMYYIDSLEYDPLQGSPKSGTEFLSRLVNPYDVYNVQSNLQAHKLFEKHNYEAAANLWEGVRNTLEKHACRYRLETEKEKTINQHRMANCYYLWDSFYYDKANNSKNRHNNSWEYNEKHVHGSIDVLQILSEVNNRRSLFEKECKVIHYAVDRYQNAVRRKEGGKFDDAIVRFTQVIEILCNYQVYQIAKNRNLTDKTNNHSLVSSASCLTEDWRISELIHFLFRENWTYNHRYRIANSDELLQIDKYDYKNTNEITKLIKPRNEFIHFSTRMNQSQTESNTENLRQLALAFLKDFSEGYCCANGLFFQDLLELHRFSSVT